MAKNIEPTLRTIGEYLKLKENTQFVIPQYQRSYSWTIENCDKLWQDIENFINDSNNDDENNYFFGTIIINCQENDKVFELIDGQQRTITFLLLIKALLIRINEALCNAPKDGETKDTRDALTLRKQDLMGILYRPEDYIARTDKELDKKIYGKNPLPIGDSKSINESYPEELKHILMSYDCEEAESKVEKISYKHKDNKYTNFFRNFKFFLKKVGEMGDLKLSTFTKTLIDKCEIIVIKSWQFEQAINMFNSLNSAGLPLYDSDIISSNLYAKAEEQECSDDFKDKWKELKKLIDELEKNKITDIDNILMQQMYFERARDKKIVKNGTADVTTPGLRRYFTKDNQASLDKPIEFCEQLINLAKIWDKVSAYPVIQVLLKFNKNSKLFLASYFHRFKVDDISEETVNEIAICLLRLFAVLAIVDTSYSSKKFKVFLFKEVEKLADSTISVQEIKVDFDKHISSSWKHDEERNEIEEYISEYDGDELVYLNEYLFAKEIGCGFSLESNYNIEHIMPQSGAKAKHDDIRKDARIKNDEEFKDTVDKLGNKILLEEKINKSLGNDWFRSKLSGYKNSCYPIATALVKEYENVPKPEWTKEKIDKATDRASERIVKFIFSDK